MSSKVLSAVLAGALAIALSPHQADGQAARQSYGGAFTTGVPAAPTGLRIAFDYRDPADPDGKPPAVAEVVQQLHAGARIDTTVPERCAASDAQFAARGAAACPVASHVGGGVLHADTGAPGGPQPRVVEFDVTLVNAADQLVLVLESTNLPAPVRLASRSRVTGPATYVSTTPPLPAPSPDDPFVAIRHARLTVDEITRDGRAYLTTPPACPGDGAWRTTGTFTYRDGVVERVTDVLPCERAQQQPAAAPVRASVLAVSRPAASARLLNRRGGIGVALRIDGTLRDVAVRLVDRRTGRTVARAAAARGSRDLRLFLARARRARPGRHDVVATARAADRVVRATRTVRLRR